ncbi:MAG: hypothetical protein QMC81_07710 [Thermoanaerobacterales bacterium]|nr:hypothetical protein [Thermoanaerobacterales bacterium]
MDDLAAARIMINAQLNALATYPEQELLSATVALVQALANAVIAPAGELLRAVGVLLQAVAGLLTALPDQPVPFLDPLNSVFTRLGELVPELKAEPAKVIGLLDTVFEQLLAFLPR